MRDYYQDGIDDGFGAYRSDKGDYPQDAGDIYDYHRGLERGQQRRKNVDEFEREVEFGWESDPY